MSHNYEKHTWSVGEVITKALIDRMETGIDNAVDLSGDTMTGKLILKMALPALRFEDNTNSTLFTEIQDNDTGTGNSLNHHLYFAQYIPNATADNAFELFHLPVTTTGGSRTNYHIFTSKGTTNGAAYWDSGTATDNDLQYGILPIKYGGLGFVPTQNGALYVNTDSQNNKVITVATLPVIRGGTGLTTVPENYLLLGGSATNVPLKTLAPGSNGQVLKIVNGAPAWNTDNNTTYSLSLNGNTLSLTGNNGTSSTVTLTSGIAYSLAADNDNNKIYLSGSTGNTGFTVTKGTNETLSLNQTTHLIDCKIPTLKAANELYVNVSGDMMIGALKIGRYNDNPPEDTPNIQIQGSAINTYGTSNVLGGWTAIYADRTDVNSNGVALQVYGQSKFEKSLACDGVVKGVFLYEVMKAPQATTDNGHTVIQAATSVPAINILYNALINSTNATATAEKSLASIWTRNIKTDNTTTPPTYTQYGTERQLCFGVSAYRNAWFTSNTTVPTEEELLNTYNNDNQTTWTDWSQTGTTYLNYLSVKGYSATDQPAGTNERYDFNFYFPVCKDTDWTDAYRGKWPAKFTPYYEILTSKNYRFIAGSYYLTSAIELGSSTTTANFTILFQATNDETFTMPDSKYSAYIMLTDRNASNTTNNITINGPYVIYTTNHSSTQLTVIINGFGNTITLPIGTKIDYFVGYGTPCVSSYKDNE